MAEFSYLTVESTTRGLYKEKGSKFIGVLMPVSSEAEAKQQLDQLKKEYYDARHHCFAWIIGPDKALYRASDDGEPHHSAGDPILGQLKSKKLTNVMAVVARYFGGTKLGVGGLIVAYRMATQDALEKAVIIEKEIYQKLIIKYEYALTPEVMRLVKDFDLKIEVQDFQVECHVEVVLKLILKEKFEMKLALLNAMGIPIKIQWLV